MTTLQEYLNEKYSSSEAKKEVKKIDIYQINQERENQSLAECLEGGSLDLREYPRLEVIIINGRDLKSPLTSLEVSNCSQLTKLNCRFNQLTNLNLMNQSKKFLWEQQKHLKFLTKDEKRAEQQGKRVNFGAKSTFFLVLFLKLRILEELKVEGFGQFVQLELALWNH